MISPTVSESPTYGGRLAGAKIQVIPLRRLFERFGLEPANAVVTGTNARTGIHISAATIEKLFRILIEAQRGIIDCSRLSVLHLSTMYNCTTHRGLSSRRESLLGQARARGPQSATPARGSAKCFGRGRASCRRLRQRDRAAGEILYGLQRVGGKYGESSKACLLERRTARDCAHAAVVRLGVVDGDPCGNHTRALGKPPVHQVLMPTDINRPCLGL